jgi:hypothetical protein
MDTNISRKAVIILMALSGCISKQLVQNHEYDDLYYTSKDRQVLAAQKAEQVKTEPVKIEEKKQPDVSTGKSDTYIYHYDSKEAPKPVTKPDASADSVQNVKTEPVKVEEKKQPEVKPGQSDTYIYHYDSKDPKPVKQDSTGQH